ncbi:hypothetical protein [Streptomyces sp. MAR4 CNX-425]|uniref:hypothetical protein n=1 Tax=Streptomyces sp. MAR4 CNX-425 TaxID=3406343 RepID=UPI003B5029A5
MRRAADYRLAGGLAELRFRNDGAGAPVPPARTPAAPARDGAPAPAPGPAAVPDAAGSGLPGLAERLRAAGGELRWRRDGDRFEVVAALPGPANGAPR